MQYIMIHRKKLGLTHDEARLYERLLDIGPMDASTAAIGMDVRRHAIYRLANKLAERQFVVIRAGRPRIFEAVPLSVALSHAERRYADGLASVKTAPAASAPPGIDNAMDNPGAGDSMPAHEVTMLSGRQKLYDRYAMEAAKAETEILAYTIGIAYNPHLHQVQEDARRRNVEVRHIVQQYTPENYHIVRKWRRLGVKMRHDPAPLGFHLMVFDVRTVIMSLSNHGDAEQRTTMVLQNPAAAVAMRDYFYGVWARARLIA